MTMETTTKPTLTLDVDLYQRYLDESDLTDAQKKELLETLWSIICEFVRLGYGVHPLQQILPETGGKAAQTSTALPLPDVIMECTERALSDALSEKGNIA